MKNAFRLLLRLWFLSITIFLVFCFGFELAAKKAVDSWATYQTAFVRDHLPENLGTTGFAQESSDLAFWAVLLPIRHEACGGAILRLDPETTQKIESKGLDFLRAARRRKESRGSSYTDFEPWAATPVPGNWVREGGLVGVNCMRLKETEVVALHRAAKTPGSFYTGDHRDQKLLVVPDLGVVLWTYEH